MPQGLGLLEKVYIFTALVTAVESFALSMFVLLRNKDSRLNRSYSVFGCCVGLWSLSLFFCHLSSQLQDAVLLNRFVHFFSVLIAISFYHFIHTLLKISGRRTLNFGVVAAVVIGGLCFTPLMIQGMAPKFGFRLWPVPGCLYQIYLAFFSFYSYYSLFLVFRHFCKETGVRKEQLRYIFIALSVGFIGGSSNFAYSFNIPIPPVGNLFVFLYVLILAYAIVRYRLMDIRIVAASTLIFIAVYAITLGVPFYFYKIGFHLYSLILMGVLATIGPSIYLYLQRRANNILLKEQRRYQQTLIQASSGMGRIKDLKKLLKLIVRIVMGAIKPEYCSVYLYDRESKTYILNTVLYRKRSNDLLKSFPEDSKLVEFIFTEGRPILSDELRTEKASKIIPSVVALELASLGVEMIVPSIIDDRMVAFLALGQKSSGTMYTADDINVFTILANQSALAIENAQFYEDVRRTQEQLFKAEKMATIGTMADGLSHQINNRFHAMGFVAGDMQDTLDYKKDVFNSDEARKVVEELHHGLQRIQENVKHGGEIVRGLLKYTRHTDEGVAACDIDKIFDSAYEMVQFKVKSGNMKIEKLYDPGSSGIASYVLSIMLTMP